MDEKTALHDKLQVRYLPPLSPTAAKLLGVLSDDDIDLKALSAIIDRDPAVAARIVGLANSAYFAQPSPVYSVEEAIIRVLGLDMVKSLALGISVAGVFNLEKCPAFDLGGYWFNALACSQLIVNLADLVPSEQRPNVSGLHLGALLHNLGALLLAHAIGEDYVPVLVSAGREPETKLLELEREQLGFDHQEAGLLLAGRWHLPALIVTMMGQLGKDDYRGTYQTEVNLLNCTVERVNGVRAGSARPLDECRWLHRIDGFDRQRIPEVEVAFLEQADDLELVARQFA